MPYNCFVNYLFELHETKALKLLSLITALLTLISISLSAPLDAKTWSEEKLGKSVISIDRDLNKKRWEKVIERSRQALPHCIAIHSERHERCIVLLRNINLGYEKTHRFNPAPKQIEQAYALSVEVLGIKHLSARMSRRYLYKYFLFTERYAEAIPLVNEIIDVEAAGDNDPFKILERINQLYALQGILENWPEEESALLRLHAMTLEFIGEESKDYKAAGVALAENYCIQKKYHEFFELVKKQNLEVPCKTK